MLNILSPFISADIHDVTIHDVTVHDITIHDVTIHDIQIHDVTKLEHQTALFYLPLKPGKVQRKKFISF